MAGSQEFEVKAVDAKMTDPQEFEDQDAGIRMVDSEKIEKDSDIKLVAPQDFKEKDSDLGMADPQELEEKNAILEMTDPSKFEEIDTNVDFEVLPQYQANGVDAERANVEIVDDGRQHTWLCPGGDPAHWGCPGSPTRRGFCKEWRWELLELAVIALLGLLVIGITVWSAAKTDSGDSHAQAENCTMVYSYASSMGACVNGTKLD